MHVCQKDHMLLELGQGAIGTLRNETERNGTSYEVPDRELIFKQIEKYFDKMTNTFILMNIELNIHFLHNLFGKIKDKT